MSAHADVPLFHMNRDLCLQARQRLDWGIDRLADESGVSPLAIEQFESGFRRLKPISLQAIAYAFEAKGLMFIPGYGILTGDNIVGACPDPQLSDDYFQVE